MLKRNLLLILIISLPLFLTSQDQNFVIEENGMTLEVVTSDPEILAHFPTGLIYRDSAYNYMSNISSRSITVADGPFGFGPPTEIYDKTTLDYNSLEFTKNTSNKVASWGPRSEGSLNYDIETQGTIQSLATDGRTFSELTSTIGEGLVKVYRYGLFSSTTGTFSVDGFNAPSDRRLKHDIKPMTKLLPKVMQLLPSTYIYNGFSDSSQGFIAQDVQKIFPELVSEIDGYLAVNYTGFSTIAIQAIKEQQETISSLTAQVQAFETRLAALEKSK